MNNIKEGDKVLIEAEFIASIRKEWYFCKGIKSGMSFCFHTDDIKKPDEPFIEKLMPGDRVEALHDMRDDASFLPKGTKGTCILTTRYSSKLGVIWDIKVNPNYKITWASIDSFESKREYTYWVKEIDIKKI